MQKENNLLWEAILAFDIEETQEEYGFGLKLAHKHNWSLAFTQQAIVEYKKFMYLVAINDHILSPSQIIDEVWHLHILYADNYAAFCKQLGKSILHIPSRNSTQEQDKMHEALSRTKEAYLKHFGEMPTVFWQAKDAYASLNWSKAKFNVQQLLLSFLIVLMSASLLILIFNQSLDLALDKPIYILSFILTTILVLVFVNIGSNYYLKRKLNNQNKDSFLLHLNALELIALKKDKANYMIHALLNSMVEEQILIIGNDQTLFLNTAKANKEKSKLHFVQFMQSIKGRTYKEVYHHFAFSAYISTISKSMSSLKRYILSSQVFMKMYLFQFLMYTPLLIWSLMNIIVCINKSQFLIFYLFQLFVIVLVIYVMFGKTTQGFFTHLLPKYYFKHKSNLDAHKDQLLWKYLKLEHLAYTASFVPLISNVDTTLPKYETCATDHLSDATDGGCASCGGE